MKQDLFFLEDIKEKKESFYIVSQRGERPGDQEQKAPARMKTGATIPGGICVELDPPRDCNISKIIQAAKSLKKIGVNHITIADNPMASVRIDAISMAGIIKRETDINVIPHLTCRDRNRIALRSAVMGSYAQGIHSMLCVTGDPVKMYHEPNTTGVFDVNSIGLVKLVSDFNQNEDIEKKIAVGVALNPNARSIDGQIRKLRRKVEAGAHFVLTQPVYSRRNVESLFDRLAGGNLKLPVFLGVFPLTSAKIANYLHNKVPGIAIPDDVMNKLNRYNDLKDQRAKAEEILMDLLQYFLEFSSNYYLIAPKNNSEILEPIIHLINERGKNEHLHFTG